MMLDKMEWLPKFWREICTQLLVTLEPQERAEYENRIAVLHTQITPIMEAQYSDGSRHPLRQFADQLVDVSDIQALADRLGQKFEESHFPFTALLWAIEFDIQPLPCAYCALLHHILSLPDYSVPEQLRSFDLSLLCNSLTLLGCENAAVALLESYVGLEAGDYGNVEQLRRKLREAQQVPGALAGLTANNRAAFLQTLADALSFVSGRGSEQAALLLESYVGLETADYGSVEQLSRKLREAQQEPGALAGLTANNRATFLKTLANALSFVPGRGREQAALLLESYVGLEAEDYGNVDQLSRKLRKRSKSPERWRA